MALSTSSIFIFAALIGFGAAVLRAVRAARQRVSPVRITVRVERSRRQEGSKYA